MWNQCPRGSRRASNAGSSSPHSALSGRGTTWRFRELMAHQAAHRNGAPFLTQQPSCKAETRGERRTGSPLHQDTPAHKHWSRGCTVGTVLLQEHSCGCHNSADRQRQSCNLLSPGMNTLSIPQHPSPRCCQSPAETAWSSHSTGELRTQCE